MGQKRMNFLSLMSTECDSLRKVDFSSRLFAEKITKGGTLDVDFADELGLGERELACCPLVGK